MLEDSNFNVLRFGKHVMMLFAIVQLNCNWGSGEFKGTVLDVSTMSGIKNISIYCDVNPADAGVIKTPYRSKDGGRFVIKYSGCFEQLSPRICVFVDEDGLQNGGQYNTVTVQVDTWCNKGIEKPLVYLTKI